jgi:NAD(P)-dependent dehydrogenase (short-subunit alcohol dehydrogenase family)
MTKQKVVLITGCSSGFGLLSAVDLAKDHHVIATMRNISKGDPLEIHYNSSTQPTDPGSLTILPLDVTKSDTITPCIKTVMDTFNQIDVLINNAGYAQGGFFEDLSEKNIRDQLETNLIGVMNLTRAVLPLMRSQKNGHIIMISSIAGRASTPALSAYNASKFALEGFSESLLFELADFNIDITLIEPGIFKTDIFTKNLTLGDYSHNPNSIYFEWTQKLLKKLETTRIHQNPKEVVRIIKKAITSPSPRFRYVIGKDAKLRLFLKTWLPFTLYKKIVLSSLKKIK